MNRPTLNMIVDAIVFCEFTLLAATGVFIEYVLPPRTGRFLTVLGLDRHDWGEIHFWIAVMFFTTLALHLILHWKWIVAVIRGRKRESSPGYRVALALVGLIALAGLAAAPFLAPVEHSTELRGRAVSSAASEELAPRIRGSMTLGEIAQTLSISVKTLIAELDLPADTSPDDRLGRLARTQSRSTKKCAKRSPTI